MQFQAGYILEAVRDQLKFFAKQHRKKADLHGLLRSLSTFNVHTNLNLESPSNIPSILAVASNILTRGLPTIASIHTEQFFANAFSLTKRMDDIERGNINFRLASHATTQKNYESIFNALHIIDPRAKNRLQYLNLSDLDSSFERNFILNFLPEKMQTRESPESRVVSISLS